MKTAALGVVFTAAVTSVLVVGLGQWNTAWADRASGVEVSSDLITITAMVGDKTQQLTVIEPRARVMSVYHVELANGAITLKSVRNIHWDLQLSEFNGTAPLPREIRALLETR
jgi:hypothetical protein